MALSRLRHGFESRWGRHINSFHSNHLRTTGPSPGVRGVVAVPVFVPTRVNREALSTARRVSASVGWV